MYPLLRHYGSFDSNHADYKQECELCTSLSYYFHAISVYT